MAVWLAGAVWTTISNEHVDEVDWKGIIMNPATESPIKDDTILVTARGYERLCQELRRVCAEHRQEMDEQLLQARWEGTLNDNPELLLSP